MSQVLSLSKPRVILLLLITGIIGFIIPDINSVNFVDLLIFVISGYLSSGGAMMINSYIDQDIDKLMERTKKRVIVIEELKFNSHFVLIFGTIMATLGILIGWIYFNEVVGLFLAWGVLFYIFGYTLYLKRKSFLNTIFGGLASPAPVWAGYAARLPSSSTIFDMPLEGWFLGFLVFIWTPSHTWALATKYIDDYKKAKIPMLPVKFGINTTSRIVYYWGLGVIIFGSITAYIITRTIKLQIILLGPHLLLFYGLRAFYSNPSVNTGGQCFKLHNVWLGLVFLFLILGS
ncbi:MAG: Protoheme IX farnesyltransferase [Candidatus Heimdallarchaeota archaeon LC_2]|nr:MAG: Protoheme IX farnesyltransferase [Candidatus Heimdallarchaeota archaeon LC_2]